MFPPQSCGKAAWVDNLGGSFAWILGDWQLEICSSYSCSSCQTDGDAPVEHVQVQLLRSENTQPGHAWDSRHSLTQSDSFDITFTPRSLDPLASTKEVYAASSVTPRQRDLQGQLELPALQSYPIPPGCSPQLPQEDQRRQLLEMYHGFALDLHRGMYLTQLMSDRSYSDIHCQLMEDLSTLKLDQGTGRIVEYPLANVSKVYRLWKAGSKLYTADKKHSSVPADSDQIIVIVFSKRKLAFVFKESKASQRFVFCMELLIWRAQQLAGLPLLRSCCSSRSAPAIPSPGLSMVLRGTHEAPCPTPRLVRDGEGPPPPHRGDGREFDDCTPPEDSSSGVASKASDATPERQEQARHQAYVRGVRTPSKTSSNRSRQPRSLQGCGATGDDGDDSEHPL
uniref:Uncharacterized protein n=1 Tax=Alexandrium monilatum TaxID=311494 RepID=A0A7S4QZP4_9DINO|mmetsp:Transcript_61463/g.183180  ORF Transcript_61463/g.183180 Transcript_61463/m.183180 type:complete len:395 (+) Transcript_61463:57-1241(+)